MLGRLRKRVTYANAVATPALFVALGGTSYAAVKITGKDIRNNTITSADIKNRSLLALDFKAGQIPAGPRGLQGVQGPAGSQGAAGPQGPPGTAPNVRLVTSDSDTVPVGAGTSNITASAGCPPGTFAIGGGGVTQNGDAVLTDSFADSVAPAVATTWTVVYRNDTAVGDSIFATAVCAGT